MDKPERFQQTALNQLGVHPEYERAKGRIPPHYRRLLPLWLRRRMTQLYWLWHDCQDFLAEVMGWLPSHTCRLFLYRHIAKIRIGSRTSIHRGCRFYQPSGIAIGHHTVINRDVLLDGRRRIVIGDNVSISEGVAIFTLEHDPNSSSFDFRGDTVLVGDRVFIGARALILPGIKIGEGAVVAAGSVVTHDVEPYQIVAGVPARIIASRERELTYVLDYRKFFG
jgi:maltose O-acetyltransferase